MDHSGVWAFVMGIIWWDVLFAFLNVSSGEAWCLDSALVDYPLILNQSMKFIQSPPVESHLKCRIQIMHAQNPLGCYHHM